MHAPIRLISGRWPAMIEQRLRRFTWTDPSVVLDPSASAVDFRSAMSAFHVGETIKITSSGRHPASDALLLDNVDLAGMAIVDIGASDGSTSVDLIQQMEGFKSYTIADLFFNFSAIQVSRHTLFFDQNGQWILIAGRRLLGWPTLSPVVRAVYQPFAAAAARRPDRRHEILLLNPDARALIAANPRVHYRVHDVFTPWDGPSPDVVKVANLLRRLYFSDETISRALTAILQSLSEGGHFLVVDNPRIEGISERGGLYRKLDGRFELVAQTANAPEIADLIEAIGAKTSGSS